MSPYQPAWGEDHAKFLEALRSAYDPNDQEALPNVERRAYAVAPRSLPPDEHHDYRNRAANRGRHRAMLQAALRALATNAEQHHRREQAAGVLDLVPRPLKEPASPPARPAPAVPTYRLTRAKILVRQDQERLEKLLLAKKSSARLLDGWQQDVFAKSFASVSLLQLSLVKAEMILNRTAEWIERQRAALVNNTHRYSWSIRSRVAAVIEAIDRGLAMPALDLTSYSWISRSELAPLTIIRSAPFKDVPFTRLVGMAQNAGQLIRKIQRRLAEADSIYRTRVAHVEQARIALRALRQEVHDCSLLADPTLASVLQLAVPLYHGVMPLQGDLAAKVVRCEVVKEVIKCAGSSPIDLAQAWSFTASIPKRARGKRWFYLEKWPVQPNGAQGTRSGQSTGSSNLSSLSSGSLGGAVPMSVDERADSPVEAAPPKEGPEDVNVAAGWEALADAWGPRITEVPPLGDTPGAAVPLEMPIFDNDQAVVDRGSEKDVNGFMPTTLPRRPTASEEEQGRQTRGHDEEQNTTASEEEQAATASKEEQDRQIGGHDEEQAASKEEQDRQIGGHNEEQAGSSSTSLCDKRR
ncbi:MAG: hypothetical protein M1826_004985 [Phylliscum demangeonii]|nr:MAG: hypothetical protein M1826_004985 [Phylliscum demangeonii]